MINIFEPDDRNGKVTNIQKTISGMSRVLSKGGRILTTNLAVLQTPLIIQSSFDRNSVSVQAPYYTGQPIPFGVAFTNAQPLKKNIAFFIIANHYTHDGKMFSHMLMGLWWPSARILNIIDPNGNNVALDNIYSGRGFRAQPKSKNSIINPLYNSLTDYFKKFFRISVTIRYYTGEPIICPAGGAKSCTYRTIMIMLSLNKKGPLKLKESMELANYLAANKFQEVKNWTEQVFKEEQRTPLNINGNSKKGLSNDYISISPSRSSSSSSSAAGSSSTP